MAVSKYLGKFVPFGADDPSVLMSATLTSANDLGRGTAVGTPVYDAVKGMKMGSGTYLAFDGTTAAANTIVPNIGLLDRGCTIQFEFEASRLFTAGNGNEGLLTWSTQAGGLSSNWKYFYGSNVSANLAGFLALTNIGSSNYSTLGLRAAGKGTFIQVHLSFRCGYVDVYIDKGWCGRYGNDENPAEANLFYNVRLGRLTSSASPFEGYMRNIQVVDHPVNLPVHKTVGRICQIGDSISATGNYETQSTDDWAFDGPSTSITSAPGVWDDVGCTLTIQRKFAQDDVYTRVKNYCVSGYTVEATGSSDIIDQIDGSASVNALDDKPHWIVLMGGTNDSNTNTFASGFFDDAGTFDTSYQAIIDQIKADSPDTKILCCTILSTENDTTYNNKQAEVNAANARIAEIVDENSQTYLCDTFTLFGGHSFDSADFNASDLHLSAQGTEKLGRFVYAAIKTVENL